MIVNLTVESISSGFRDDSDLCAALASLGGIVHGRIDSHLLHRFRWRRRHSLTDLVVHGGIGLAVIPGNAKLSGIRGESAGCDLARGLAVKQVIRG